MSELPQFPKYPDGLTDLGRALGDTPVAVYERARAEAYKARLEVAMSHLEQIKTLQISNTEISTGRTWPGDAQQLSAWKSELAKEALALIGDLP